MGDGPEGAAAVRSVVRLWGATAASGRPARDRRVPPAGGPTSPGAGAQRQAGRPPGAPGAISGAGRHITQNSSESYSYSRATL